MGLLYSDGFSANLFLINIAVLMVSTVFGRVTSNFDQRNPIQADANTRTPLQDGGPRWLRSSSGAQCLRSRLVDAQRRWVDHHLIDFASGP